MLVLSSRVSILQWCGGGVCEEVEEIPQSQVCLQDDVLVGAGDCFQGGATWCQLPGRGETQSHAMTGTGLLGQVEARQSGSFIPQGLNSAMVR